MKPHRTRRIFGLLVAGYALLAMPALFWAGYMDSPAGVLFAVPYLFVYLFHGLGVPGLLQHGGACGWGWCAPTVFGWVFLVGFWLGVAWGAGTRAGRADCARGAAVAPAACSGRSMAPMAASPGLDRASWSTASWRTPSRGRVSRWPASARRTALRTLNGDAVIAERVAVGPLRLRPQAAHRVPA